MFNLELQNIAWISKRTLVYSCTGRDVTSYFQSAFIEVRKTAENGASNGFRPNFSGAAFCLAQPVGGLLVSEVTHLVHEKNVRVNCQLDRTRKVEKFLISRGLQHRRERLRRSWRNNIKERTGQSSMCSNRIGSVCRSNPRTPGRHGYQLIIASTWRRFS